MTPKQFCKKYLENYPPSYIINSNDTIDVDGDVDLEKILNNMKLPVKFGKVSGIFSCNFNELTTLEGCPNYVGGDFSCNFNNLTSLEYCPKYIGGCFYCENLTHHILGNIQGKIYHIRQRIVI
jgi:hypothetical protein